MRKKIMFNLWLDEGLLLSNVFPYIGHRPRRMLESNAWTVNMVDGALQED